MYKPLALLLAIALFSSCKKKKVEDPPPASTSDVMMQTFGSSKDDRPLDILVANNLIYILGNTKGYGNGGEDVMVVCYNNWGNRLWYKTYGGPNNDHAEHFSMTGDGHLLISGYTDAGSGKDGYVVKTDMDGNAVWEKNYDLGFDEHLWGGVEESGAYYFTGSQDTNGIDNILIMKTDLSGNIILNKSLGGVYDDAGRNIIRKGNGNVLAMAMTYSYGFGNRDVLLVEYDQNGDSVNSTPLGSPQYEQPGNLMRTSSGEILTTYHSVAVDPAHNLAATLVDANLNTKWVIDTGTTIHEGGEDVCEIPTGYILAGNTGYFTGGDNDCYLVYTDFNGKITKTETFPLPHDQWLKGVAVQDGWIHMIAADNRKGNYDFLLMSKKL